jgi:hypothetical protein
MATKRRHSRKKRKTRKGKSKRGGMFKYSPFSMFRKQGNSADDKIFIKQNYFVLDINNVDEFLKNRSSSFEKHKDRIIVARGDKFYIGTLSKNDGKFYLENMENFGKHLLLNETDIIYLQQGIVEPILIEEGDLKGRVKKRKSEIENEKKFKNIINKRSPLKIKINDVYYEDSGNVYTADVSEPLRDQPTQEELNMQRLNNYKLLQQQYTPASRMME